MEIEFQGDKGLRQEEGVLLGQIKGSVLSLGFFDWGLGGWLWFTWGPFGLGLVRVRQGWFGTRRSGFGLKGEEDGGWIVGFKTFNLFSFGIWQQCLCCTPWKWASEDLPSPWKKIGKKRRVLVGEFYKGMSILSFLTWIPCIRNFLWPNTIAINGEFEIPCV